MSTKSFESALDFMPDTHSGKGGASRNVFKLILEAFNEGREAEATYRREIARGTHPAKAAAKAFSY